MFVELVFDWLMVLLLLLLEDDDRLEVFKKEFEHDVELVVDLRLIVK